MCLDFHRHPIFCIVPPHILREMARRGTGEQRDMALNTLAFDQTARASRITYQLLETRAHSVLAYATPSEKKRTIFNARNTDTLPGDVVRTEGQGPTRDVAVNEAYDGLGDTYDFYSEIFDRNSIDDEGLALNATVHYRQSYDNAFWNGEQMVFGDGDGELFNRFTISLDVIGHELTHGVTGDEANLTYLGQSGALNESISDVFGSLVKQFKLNQTADKADWLIGEGLLTKKVQGRALRDMANPGTAYDDSVLGKDPQPADMAHYVKTADDNGGVHINSGIPNRAFYLVAKALGGHAWEKAGRIWYDTLRDPRLKRTAKFTTFAKLTAINAGHLYGTNSTEQKAVYDAWKTVGVKIPKTTSAQRAAG
jgi:Zn-dependent metalloprotease